MNKEKYNNLFIHSWWRTGSTYFFEKFRKDINNFCYYEPLHENLLFLNKEKLKDGTPSESELGHIDSKKPYFLEFEPFIENNTIKNFKKEFSYDIFELTKQSKQINFKKYLNLLINYSNKNKKNTVLAFTRSMFRIEWMKENFKACHIFLLRDPLQQWISYLERWKKKDIYFVLATVLIIGKIQDCKWMHATMIDNNNNIDTGEDAFIDTAAIIKNLDLVISSDTSIVHLSGAMEKKIWMLQPKVPNWPWTNYGRTSPWYLSLEIFRQEKKNSWEQPINDLKNKLLKIL